MIAWGAASDATTESLFTREMIVGGTTADDDSVLLARALNTLLGTRFRIIGGYSGAIALQIGMERGEIAGFLADAARGEIAVSPLPGHTLEAMLGRLTATPARVRNRAAEALGPDAQTKPRK